MFFAWILAFFGLLLVFLEFFLPGMIMIIGGALLLSASLFVFHMQNQGSSWLFFGYCCVLSGVAWGVVRLALLIIRHSAKKGTLCLKSDQEGFKASFFNSEFIGKRGMAATDLRPSGRVIVEGAVLQAVSRSGFIENKSEVVVDGGDGGHLVVSACRGGQKEERCLKY